MNEPRRDLPGIVAPPPLLYAAGLAVGLLVQHRNPQPLLPPAAGRLLGVAAILLGLGAFAAIAAFRRAGTSPNPYRPAGRLVTAGPYRLSRNPMYLGFTLWYVGISCWANSLWSLLLLPLVLLVMHQGVIAREEAYLERRFGDEYRQYRARVRRWL
jgi:protein-S-isoprenylcysteine O-methyltransferase Ste14